MAPEQAEPGEVDTRVDIYALGVIFYEMLTGQKPYQSESVIEVIHMHKRSPIPRLRGDLAVFQGLLDLMLAKDRNDRFRDVPALLHYLGTVRAQWPLRAAVVAPAPIAGATRLTWDQPSSPRVRVALYTLLALAAFGYGALFIIEERLRTPPQQADPGDLAQVAAARAALAAPPDENPTGAGVDPATVATALLWLGEHSLNAQQLTMPPNDNAYYYFSRVLQLDPANAEAQRGVEEVAKRYALLADAAIARGESERAQAYLAIGRQIDPDNEALQVISQLAAPPGGVWQTLLRWWRGSS